MGAHINPIYPYRAPTDLMHSPPLRKPLIVIGAGPVGLAAAVDARLRGLPVLVFDDDKTVSVGSRAVCYAKRALEVLDRLGVGQPICDLGVSWNIGRTFLDEQEVYQFNLVPEPGHKRPGMVNLQQYHIEALLIERALALGADIRWQHKVLAVRPQADHATLTVQTPDGEFEIEADWLVVADGARSPVRHHLGLDIEGRVFQDRFLIADVIMKADYPAERWFWFDPPFHRNQSVLLHKQSNNVWRVDFQLGWDADPEEEKKPEKVIPRLQTMLGQERPFELEWVSIYTFQCRRMTDFRHGRVLFVGDAAHQVSPFGARGANSGFQDVDDLLWKLALVMRGQAPERLLDSYAQDRQFAADENILNSTRSTDFITPKSRTSKTFRNEVLALARQHPFARKLVNSGRLSVPSFLTESVLNTADTDAFAGAMVPGAPMDDAPVQVHMPAADPTGANANASNNAAAQAWLLDQVGSGFACLLFADALPPPQGLAALQTQVMQAQPAGAALPIGLLLVIPPSALPPAQHSTSVSALASASAAPPALALPPGVRVLVDAQGWVSKRYDGQPGTTYLLRPDQHVAARWRRFEPARIAQALAKALARTTGQEAFGQEAAEHEATTKAPTATHTPSAGVAPAAAAPATSTTSAAAAPSGLITEPHFHEPGRRFFRDFSPGDEFYEALIDSHQGLSDAHSEALNARLVLLLANHIGDLRVLRQALAAARAA